MGAGGSVSVSVSGGGGEIVGLGDDARAFRRLRKALVMRAFNYRDETATIAEQFTPVSKPREQAGGCGDVAVIGVSCIRRVLGMEGEVPVYISELLRKCDGARVEHLDFTSFVRYLEKGVPPIAVTLRPPSPPPGPTTRSSPAAGVKPPASPSPWKKRTATTPKSRMSWRGGQNKSSPHHHHHHHHHHHKLRTSPLPSPSVASVASSNNSPRLETPPPPITPMTPSVDDISGVRPFPRMWSEPSFDVDADEGDYTVETTPGNKKKAPPMTAEQKQKQKMRQRDAAGVPRCCRPRPADFAECPSTCYPSVWAALGFRKPVATRELVPTARKGKGNNPAPNDLMKALAEGGFLDPTKQLWKKREIVAQERIVMYTTIDREGNLQELVETERSRTEVLHMECKDTGEFAHRESTEYEEEETFNDSTVMHQLGKEEYLHLKSRDDEFEHMESNMPQTKQQREQEEKAAAEAAEEAERKAREEEAERLELEHAMQRQRLLAEMDGVDPDDPAALAAWRHQQLLREEHEQHGHNDSYDHQLQGWGELPEDDDAAAAADRDRDREGRAAAAEAAVQYEVEREMLRQRHLASMSGVDVEDPAAFAAWLRLQQQQDEDARDNFDESDDDFEGVTTKFPSGERWSANEDGFASPGTDDANAGEESLLDDVPRSPAFPFGDRTNADLGDDLPSISAAKVPTARPTPPPPPRVRMR